MEVGLRIQNDNEEPLGPDARAEENGEEVFPSSSDPGSVWQGVDTDRKRFYCRLI